MNLQLPLIHFSTIGRTITVPIEIITTACANVICEVNSLHAIRNKRIPLKIKINDSQIKFI